MNRKQLCSCVLRQWIAQGQRNSRAKTLKQSHGGIKAKHTRPQNTQLPSQKKSKVIRNKENKVTAPFNVLDGQSFPSQEGKNKCTTSKREVGWLCRQGLPLDGIILMGLSIQSLTWNVQQFSFSRSSNQSDSGD